MMAHRGEPVFDRSQRVAQNGTFKSNPVCSAAAIATLELVQDGALYARANKLGLRSLSPWTMSGASASPKRWALTADAALKKRVMVRGLPSDAVLDSVVRPD